MFTVVPREPTGTNAEIKAGIKQLESITSARDAAASYVKIKNIAVKFKTESASREFIELRDRLVRAGDAYTDRTNADQARAYYEALRAVLEMVQHVEGYEKVDSLDEVVAAAAGAMLDEFRGVSQRHWLHDGQVRASNMLASPLADNAILTARPGDDPLTSTLVEVLKGRTTSELLTSFVLAVYGDEKTLQAQRELATGIYRRPQDDRDVGAVTDFFCMVYAWFGSTYWPPKGTARELVVSNQLYGDLRNAHRKMQQMARGRALPGWYELILDTEHPLHGAFADLTAAYVRYTRASGPDMFGQQTGFNGRARMSMWELDDVETLTREALDKYFGTSRKALSWEEWVLRKKLRF